MDGRWRSNGDDDGDDLLQFPVPTGCQNGVFLSPESPLRWWRRCGTFSRKTSNPPKFLGQKASYRRRGRPRGCLGPPHHALAWPGPAHAWGWCGQPLALLRLVFWLLESSGKIGTLAFVSSNSENIHFLTFLEPKTTENRQLALWLLLIG